MKTRDPDREQEGRSEGVRAETDTMLVRLRRDGILELRYKDGVVETLETARAAAAEAARMLAGGRAEVLVVYGGVRAQTIEAREYLRTVQFASRMALLVNSPVSRVLGTLLTGLQEPLVETELFNDEDEAIQWLIGSRPGGDERESGARRRP